MKFYTVARLDNNEVTLTSTPFTDLNEAKSLKNSLNTNSSQYHIFENNLIDSNFDVTLDSMEFAKYGKGYLLQCNKNDPRWGEKYFLKGELANENDCGWWMPNNNGWFFKKEFKDDLLNFGAKLC